MTYYTQILCATEALESCLTEQEKKLYYAAIKWKDLNTIADKMQMTWSEVHDILGRVFSLQEQLLSASLKDTALPDDRERSILSALQNGERLLSIAEKHDVDCFVLKICKDVI